MTINVLAIWLLAQSNPPLNPNSVRDNQRLDFFRNVQYQREQGAVVFVGEFGAKPLDVDCPRFKVEPREPLIGRLPAEHIYDNRCSAARRPGMREVFFAFDGYAVASSSFFDQEKALPTLNERRQMVVLAVRALEAITNEEFLKLGREGLADGFPQVLKGLLLQTRRRLPRASEKDQDALAVLMLDLFEAKAISDVGCASELRSFFDLTQYYDTPLFPGISSVTQRRAEEMYAALPEKARNPPPRPKRPLFSEESRKRARARARGEKILLGSPEQRERLRMRRANEKRQEAPSETRSP
ncbi:MAG: hypothetical protein AAFZ38_06820 [Myxococcota bacterium]